MSLLLAASFLASLAGAEEPKEPGATTVYPATNLLGTLRSTHPRLLATQEDFAALAKKVGGDPQLRGWKEKLEKDARRILDQPVASYEIPDGLRLLSTSRKVLDRVYTLSLLFRLDGNRAFVDRLWKELDAVAAFQDWNPRHFLDTAEMSHAFAIAYDWTYDQWTSEQRTRIRTALIQKGLEPALRSYRGETTFGWWVKSRHNWNQVCNGGIGMGALAIADEEPALCGEIIDNVVRSLPLAMAEYGPDGAWAEGPGYWNYATSYNVVILAALKTALGSDQGLSRIPGFADNGLFPIYILGPLGKTFNYADGSDSTPRAPEMFWMAREFQKPAYASYELKQARPAPMDLVWRGIGAVETEAQALPLFRHFRNAEVATFRTGWDDPRASFLGFKAGDNKVNHSNLDLGTFVFDAKGVRWAVDLGADDYNLPAYFGKERWNYYRLRAEGHNTLVLNPGKEPDQDPRAATTIGECGQNGELMYAIADLTAAYAKHAQKVHRGVLLSKEGFTVVQDDVRSQNPADLWWFLHTPASVVLAKEGREAVLEQKGEQLVARILSPDQARFSVREAVPLPECPQPPKQAANSSVRKLAIHLPETRDLRLTVVLLPGKRGAVLSPDTFLKEHARAAGPMSGWK